MLMDTIAEFDIPSDPDELIKVDEITEQIASELDFPRQVRDDIAISVTEAVNNAIMHGNHADRKKRVHIVYLKSPDALIIKIRDEGEGFDPDNISDPTTANNLLKAKGRGLFIIKQLMDEVVLKRTPQGMEVMLLKRRRLNCCAIKS
jgi:serine/threonine-protein kinase RsbW